MARFLIPRVPSPAGCCCLSACMHACPLSDWWWYIILNICASTALLLAWVAQLPPPFCALSSALSSSSARPLACGCIISYCFVATRCVAARESFQTRYIFVGVRSTRLRFRLRPLSSVILFSSQPHPRLLCSWARHLSFSRAHGICSFGWSLSPW